MEDHFAEADQSQDGLLGYYAALDDFQETPDA
jgi:hypothetical protein